MIDDQLAAALILALILFVVFKPIFASAKMCINPNAELELKGPKADLHLEVQNIAIEMTKPQVTLETGQRRETGGRGRWAGGTARPPVTN